MNHTYLRGDMYYADLGRGIGSEQEGYRPVVIIQNNVGNKHSPTVIIASITSKTGVKAKLPTHYYIDAEDGLKLPSIVLLEQLRTVDKRRLGNFIGHLSEKHICGINHALAVSIGLIESVPKKLILCLCSTCADNFYGTGAYYLRRIDPHQTAKDTCTYCNSRKGLDYLTYVLRKKSAFSFSVKAFSPTGQMMAEILKIGIPTLVFQLLTSLSIALINRASGDYGDSVIAGMGAVSRITSMGTLVVFGFLKGFQPIAGFSYGAKKFDRLREAIKTSIIWSTSFCLVVGLVMAIFSTQIISQFTEGDTQMILAGQKSLFANGLTFILFGFYTVYSSLFLALGKGAAGFFLGACRQGICFVPAILLLPMVWGMNGILYAQPIADVISVVITVVMALHLHRELSRSEKQIMSNSEM